MLQELNVTNFALIDRLRLPFAAGLNALTGETGAGKSIIIDALELALGERASGDVVRTGADRANIEAVFDITDAAPAVRQKLDELGIPDEDGLLIVSREIARASGKSQCRMNGRLMPVSVLKEIGDFLVDVHGQHDHQMLLSADRHIDILDSWGGKPIKALTGEMTGAFGTLSELRRELEQLRTDARERARSLDLYRFQLDEIDSAELKPDEDVVLTAERTRLANAERLAASATEAYALVHGSAGGPAALDQLGDALTTIDHVASLDPAFEPIASLLRDAVSFAEDASAQLRHYREDIEFSPERLEEIEGRLDALRSLKRKYGETIEQILQYRDEVDAKFRRLETAEERDAELAAAIASAERKALAVSVRLTEERQAVGARFALQILTELGDLGMAATRFAVDLTKGKLTSNGSDRVEFLLSANPGEPLRPLVRIASGGEMSRIMLAMKSVLARSGRMPTMVFDEIDVGVGGRTGQVLAEKLANLGKDAQILCITHLPQIAARADTHIVIEKNATADRTQVDVRTLSTDQRVDEIARMLGGTRKTAAVVQHAREMLSRE